MRQKFRCAAALAAVFLALCAPCRAAEMDEHPAYLAGFADGTMRPDAPLTREQLAQMLYRLLPEDARKNTPRAAAYVDVAANRWSYRAVCALTELGVWSDDRQAHFVPTEAVTGAEFAETLRRAGCCLPQLAAAETPADADAPLSRGQAVRALNALLGRTDETALRGVLTWRDVDEGSPYYADVREAANPHSVMPDGTWGAVG